MKKILEKVLFCFSLFVFLFPLKKKNNLRLRFNFLMNLKFHFIKNELWLS